MSKDLKASGQSVTEQRPEGKFEGFKNMLMNQKGKIEKVLPSHITFERFQSVVMTACMANPELLDAHRPSLLLACVKAATDGLLPDNREAAFPIFNSKIGKDQAGKDVWGKVAVYMPMVYGVLKKIRQSGEVLDVKARVVYRNDKFAYVLGDEERIEHVPTMGERGEIIAAYCIAKLANGEVVREVMTRDDIERVRKTSKTGDKDGKPANIWASWYDEMARKTVVRRTAKYLPQSTDKTEAQRLFENDDTMQDDAPIEGAAYSVSGEEFEAIEHNPAPSMPDLKEEVQKKKDMEKAKADQDVFPGDLPSKKAEA